MTESMAALAFDAGASLAREVIDRSERKARGRADLAERADLGHLILEGDSWFDYPLFEDAAEALEEMGYRIKSVAHHGDTAEAMAYLPSQFGKLRKLFQELAEDEITPRAVLLSCGGNDIAAVFQALLNNASSFLPPVNDQVAAGLIDTQLQVAIARLIGAADAFAQRYFGRSLPVRIHGYDYPVPDGRGFLGGFLFLPGPWLKPGFQAKGYVTQSPQSEAQLQANADIMVGLIDRFNAMLKALAAMPQFSPFVRHVDLRGTLSNRVAGGAYRASWSNELHATRDGFRAVAERLHASL